MFPLQQEFCTAEIPKKMYRQEWQPGTVKICYCRGLSIRDGLAIYTVSRPRKLLVGFRQGFKTRLGSYVLELQGSVSRVPR